MHALEVFFFNDWILIHHPDDLPCSHIFLPEEMLRDRLILLRRRHVVRGRHSEEVLVRLIEAVRILSVGILMVPDLEGSRVPVQVYDPLQVHAVVGSLQGELEGFEVHDLLDPEHIERARTVSFGGAECCEGDDHVVALELVPWLRVPAHEDPRHRARSELGQAVHDWFLRPKEHQTPEGQPHPAERLAVVTLPRRHPVRSTRVEGDRRREEVVFGRQRPESVRKTGLQ